jgi:hypothetical protein
MTGREMSSPTLERIQRTRETINMDTYTSQLCEAMWYIWEGVSEGITQKAVGLSAALGIMVESFKKKRDDGRVPDRLLSAKRSLL